MKFSSPSSFRQALEDRIRTQYPHHRIPWVRKMIVFERFMARLDDRWILKGGYALQLRIENARTTQDIDLLAQNISLENVAESLLEVIHQSLGDHFEFYIERTEQEVNAGSAVRFQCTARLAGRVFERFHIDIGLDDPVVEPIEYLTPPAYLSFAEIPASPVPCYPVSQHIAEKLHALVRPRITETSRIKDLVDILFLAYMNADLRAERLLAAIRAVFDVRGDALPPRLDQIPISWRPGFNQFTRNLDFPFLKFDDAVQAAGNFLNPILSGTASGAWDPASWKWVG